MIRLDCYASTLHAGATGTRNGRETDDASTGHGGLFFRAKDPEALSAWYKAQLGIGAGCVADPDQNPDEWTWITQGGPMVFAPFKADTDYFAPDKAFMINLRVSDLDGMLAHLRDAGIAIITNPDWDHPDVGRFARIHDPENNAIELWEPPTRTL